MRAIVMACALTLLAVEPVRADMALVEVMLNGKANGTAFVAIQDSHLSMAAEDFKKLGITLPAAPEKDGRIDLADTAGLEAHMDIASQTLFLTVTAAALPHQLYDLGTGENDFPPPQSDTGAILHYDMSAMASDVRAWDRDISGGASFALDVFTPAGRMAQSAYVTANSNGWRGTRLESAMVFENPGKLSHLIVGDAINVAPGWGRAVRFGGLEWASDFRLRPGIVTQPLPAFFGQTEAPATVDVFNGAAKMFQMDVKPGPFELRNLPIVTGGGNATVVIRDILGRETSQSISLYTDAGLLAPGLEEHAIDLGFLRTGFGRTSFGYDTPLLSGNWRRGLSDTLTIQAHGEAAPGIGLLGAGAEWGLGLGSVAVDTAANMGDQSGALMSIVMHALAGPVNLYGQAMLATAGWRDLASLDLGSGGFLPPRERYQAGATVDLDEAGTLGISWISTRYTRQFRSNFLATSWSVQLPGGMFASLNGLRDFQSGALGAQLSINIPIGAGGLAGISTSSDNGRLSALARLDDPANPDGGFGYRLAGGWQDGGRFRGEANWIGRHVGLDAGVSVDQGTPSLRADANGALVFLQDRLFASHDPGGAVALVQAGEPNIRIYRENRPVALSDSHGEALITGLAPWSPNHISVESRDYDFNILVEKTDESVVPRSSSGVVLDFTPVSRHPLLVTITGSPMPLPAGTRVMLDGDEAPLFLGRNGQLFVPDLDRPRSATIQIGAMTCRIHLEPQSATMAPQPVPLLCLQEARNAP